MSNSLLEDICFNKVRLLTFHLLLMCFPKLGYLFLGSWCRGHRLYFQCSSRRCIDHLRLLCGRMNNIFHTFPAFTRKCSNCTPPTFLQTIAVCCDLSCNPRSVVRRAVFLAQNINQRRLILSYINDVWETRWLCKNNIPIADLKLYFLAIADALAGERG